MIKDTAGKVLLDDFYTGRIMLVRLPGRPVHNQRQEELAGHRVAAQCAGNGAKRRALGLSMAASLSSM
jgi:hypothetical protein